MRTHTNVKYSSLSNSRQTIRMIFILIPTPIERFGWPKTTIGSMFLPLYWPDNTHSIALIPNVDRKHVSTLILLARQYA